MTMKTKPSEKPKPEPSDGEFKNYAAIYAPRSRTRYVHLSEPNRRMKAAGEYSVDVLLPEGAEKTVEFLSKMSAHLDAYRETLSAIELKKFNSSKENPFFREAFADKEKTERLQDADGNDLISFTFKMPAMREKDGVTIPQRPKIVDSKTNVVPPSVKIGGGSELIVTGKMNAYHGQFGRGVSLYLTGAQVCKLVAFDGPSFSVQDDDDGYVHGGGAPTAESEDGGARDY